MENPSNFGQDTNVFLGTWFHSKIWLCAGHYVFFSDFEPRFPLYVERSFGNNGVIPPTSSCATQRCIQKGATHAHVFLAHARTVVLAKQLGQRTCVVCSNGHMWSTRVAACPNWCFSHKIGDTKNKHFIRYRHRHTLFYRAPETPKVFDLVVYCPQTAHTVWVRL